MTLGILETFAAYRGVDFDPTDVQAIIQVEAAEETVRSYCRQLISFVAEDEITLDGSGSRSLVLPQRPVASVTTVAVGDTEVFEDSDWVLDADNGILHRKNRFDHWPRGKQNVAVTYDHGYDPLPADLNGVILQIAARGLAGSTGQEVTQEQIGTYQVQYSATQTGGLPEAERVVLDRYRQQRLA